MRGSRLLALAVAALALTPGAAYGAVIGLADQNASAYGDARLRALKLGVARLVVPYDAATSQPQLVSNWLAAVTAAGMAPHVAFEHLKANGCPGSPCVAPSRATYAAAVRAFIARFPQVRIYTTWNEANHESQPVSGRPEAVAGYYEELKAACPTCTVVAGDVLDSGGYVRWLQRFQQATDSDPQLWGLHNYGDVTYATTEGTDAVLRTVSGQPAASAPAPATVSRTLRWSATWSKARPAILLVRARCTTTGARCAGRVVLRLRTRRTSRSTTRVATIARRSYRTRSTARVQTLRVRVGKALRQRLRASSTRRLALTVRPTTPSGAASTLTLKLSKPR